MKGTTPGFLSPVQRMNRVHSMDTSLRLIAAIIFILLGIVCWFSICPIRSTHDIGDSRAEQMDWRHS